MNLDGSEPDTLSIVLSAARDWLHTCALPGHPGQRRRADTLTREPESGSGRRLDVMRP